jgi:hypothetical protein
MKVKAVTRRLNAIRLSDPTPDDQAVAIVGGPSNQSPFRAVRSDETIQAPTETEDMKIKRSASSVAVIAQRGHGVMQFQFDKAVFRTAGDVTAWLDAGGYSDYTVEETAKRFEVSDGDTRFETGTVERTDTGTDGVVAFVGKLSDQSGTTDEPSEEPAAVVEPVADAVVEEPVARSTEINPPLRERVSLSAENNADVTDVQPVATIPAGNGTEDERASGIVMSDDLVARVDTILANPDVATVLAQRHSGHVSSYVIADIASVVSSLKYLVNDADYTGIDDASVANLKTAALSALSALAAVANQYVAEVSQVFRAQAETQVQRTDASTTVEPAPAEPATPAVEAPAADANDVEAMVARSVAAALAPVNDQIGTLTQRAEAAETEAREAREAAEAAKRELAERVEADSNRSQSRRAADDVDPPVVETAVKTERCQASRSMLSAFGSRHAR